MAKINKGSKWAFKPNTETHSFNQDDILTVLFDTNNLDLVEFSAEGYRYTQFLRIKDLVPYVESVVDPVVNAKIALEAAQKAYDLEVFKAAKFTESDVTNFMVVRTDHSFLEPQLRLLVLVGNEATFFSNTGAKTNYTSRGNLVQELNFMYQKTNLTLKDFANA